MIAMSFLYLQGGRLIDVLTAILAGSLGYLVTEILDRKLRTVYPRIHWFISYWDYRRYWTYTYSNR